MKRRLKNPKGIETKISQATIQPKGILVNLADMPTLKSVVMELMEVLNSRYFLRHLTPQKLPSIQKGRLNEISMLFLRTTQAKLSMPILVPIVTRPAKCWDCCNSHKRHQR